MYKDFFGLYNIRARISVGIIFLAPLLLHGYLLIPDLRNFSSTLIISVISLSLCNLTIVYTKQHGSTTLKICFPNGLPAQSYLMPDNDYIDEITKKRYYDFLTSQIPGFIVSEDTKEMKQQVASAITWLIAQTRDEIKFSLIAEENMSLGYSYNLLSLKKASVVLCSFLIILDAVLLYSNHHSLDSFSIFFCFVTTGLFLYMWIFIINKSLVQSCGKKYARALLAACDSPNIMPKK